jgi:hypothetical protein
MEGREREGKELRGELRGKSEEIERLRRENFGLGGKIEELGRVCGEKEELARQLCEMIDNSAMTGGRGSKESVVDEIINMKSELTAREQLYQSDLLKKDQLILELQENRQNALIKLSEHEWAICSKNHELHGFRTKIENFKTCFSELESDILKNFEQKMDEFLTKNGSHPLNNLFSDLASKKNTALPKKGSIRNTKDQNCSGAKSGGSGDSLSKQELHKISEMIKSQKTELLELIRGFSERLKMEICSLSEQALTDKSNEISSMRYENVNLDQMCW